MLDIVFDWTLDFPGLPPLTNASTPMNPPDNAASLDLPAGFRYAGIAAGIKASGKPDIALIVADQPVVGVCVTTTNQVVAAPVIVCRRHTPASDTRAIVVNSGNANACTGSQGINDALAMCDGVATRLNCQRSQVLVMSTGVIGHHLPMQTVLSGIDAASQHLRDDERGFLAAADAICTTDQFRKVATAVVALSTGTIRIAAMCKGAGMIAPNMATMLGMIFTDAMLPADQASALLSQVTSHTFNRVSVDGHTSTNDTVTLLTRQADADAADLSADDLEKLAQAMTQVCLKLAKMLVADGEGAGRFFETNVNGAINDADADQIARAVGDSPLVKTAICGGDPNWGRIVSAAGYAGPSIQPDRMSLHIDGVLLFKDGTPVAFDEPALSQAMKQSDEVVLHLVVGDGPGAASFWASDLGEDYVRFNSLYTT